MALQSADAETSSSSTSETEHEYEELIFVQIHLLAWPSLPDLSDVWKIQLINLSTYCRQFQGIKSYMIISSKISAYIDHFL